jgi:hypothetical protein
MPSLNRLEDGDFDSSDIEFEPAPSGLRKIHGEKSLQKLVENAFDYRVKSKQVVKQLQ